MRWRAGLRAGIVVGLAVASVVTARTSREAKSLRSQDDVVYLPNSEFMELASFGYENMVADLLWMRATQYYGGWRRGDHGIGFFEYLAHSVVDLDPYFEDAYRFAGMVLADDMNQPERGIALLEEGMRALPESWWLPFDAGFIEYTVNLDDAAAFRWFHRAANVPGAPEYPRRFAAFVASRAGSLEVSYELWKYIAATTANDVLREKALEYMTDLEKAISGEGPVPEWARRRRVVNGRSTR